MKNGLGDYEAAKYPPTVNLLGMIKNVDSVPKGLKLCPRPFDLEKKLVLYINAVSC